MMKSFTTIEKGKINREGEGDFEIPQTFVCPPPFIKHSQVSLTVNPKH